MEVVDLFCGAGGTSAGILKACAGMGRAVRLTAVNHWPVAIATHSLNHPGVKHICETVENLHPLDLVRGGRLELLAASCECRFHSNARGGGPCNEQSRAQAWQLVRWASDVRVENILMENVREFQHWGPLHGRTRKPLKSKRGHFFKAFVQALRNLGYVVEWKVQVAADYGDPTSRARLMLMARLGRAVVWPEATHGPGRGQGWRTARECIDWGLKGRSIFDEGGKPRLCKNTLDRIAAGLRKFGGKDAAPFLIILNGTSGGQIESTARPLDEPLPTVTCAGHIGLVEAFVLPPEGYYRGNTAKSLDQPLTTITAAAGRKFQLVEPFITHLTHQGRRPAHSVDKPLPTVTCTRRGEMALVEPFIAAYHNGPRPRVHSVNEPLRTQDTNNRYALVEPMVVKYYKTGVCKGVNEPLDTVTTKDRFMLVECEGGQMGIDIRTRMLQPHELAAAHSFPAGYRFTGNKENQTTQIGNSVPVELAAAHAREILS